MPTATAENTRALIISGWLTGIYFSTAQMEAARMENEQTRAIAYMPGDS